MATCKFRDSRYSYNPTRLTKPVSNNGTVKSCRHECSCHQAIAADAAEKELKYRGATY